MRKYYWHLRRYKYHVSKINEITDKLEDIKDGKGVSYESEQVSNGSINTKSPHELLVMDLATYQTLANKNLKEMNNIDMDNNLKMFMVSNLTKNQMETITLHLEYELSFEDIAQQTEGTKQYKAKMFKESIEKLERLIINDKEW